MKTAKLASAEPTAASMMKAVEAENPKNLARNEITYGGTNWTEKRDSGIGASG